MRNMVKWALNRLTEKSTWVSLFGFLAMINVGLDPELTGAIGENAPVIVGGVWAIAQAAVSDSKKAERFI